MRQLNTFSLNIGYCFISKRYARKRRVSEAGFHDVEELQSVGTEQHEPQLETSFDLSGLRMGGMMAAPANTSLDRIRSEISSMYREAAFARKKSTEKVERSQRAVKSHEDSTGIDLLSSMSLQKKPNDAYFKGDKVLEGLSSVDHLASKALFADVEEVLRPKDKDATLQYLHLLFPRAKSNEANTQLLQLLDKVEDTFKREKKALVKKMKQDAKNGSDDEDMMNAHRLVSETAWVNTFQALSDNDIRNLWKLGLIDAPLIQALYDGSLSDGEENVADLLEEKIGKLRGIYYLQQLTSNIRDTTLVGTPSLDLAPVLEKARSGKYDAITQTELRMLEKHEEQDTSASSINKNRKAATITPALLQRAVCPSNKLLYTVAQDDDKLKESLDVLERIKRHSLLDPEFQGAIEWAHALEEDSVDGHVRGAPDVAADNGEHNGGRHGKTRTLAGFRGPRARGSHAADVPYFYDSVRSAVPPRGDFSLPAPALSAQEKAARRGQRRRVKGRTRFGQ